MAHSKFGWSYPPGCNGPDDYMPTPTDLVEGLLELLEDAGVPQELRDEIVRLTEAWERKRAAELDAAEGAAIASAEPPAASEGQ